MISPGGLQEEDLGHGRVVDWEGGVASGPDGYQTPWTVTVQRKELREASMRQRREEAVSEGGNDGWAGRRPGREEYVLLIGDAGRGVDAEASEGGADRYTVG